VLGSRRPPDGGSSHPSPSGHSSRDQRRRDLRHRQGIVVLETRRRGLTLFSAICAFIGTLLVIQLWLVSASLDALLGGDRSIAGPAAAASLALFAVNGALLLHALRYDRDAARR